MGKVAKNKVTRRMVTLLCTLLLCIGAYTTAFAANESENNDSAATADTITMGNTMYGNITEGDLDLYKFSLSQSGKVSLTVTSYMEYYCVGVIDTSGDTIWYSEHIFWNEALELRRDTYDLELEKGTYYIKIIGSYYYGSWASLKYTGNYEMITTFKASGANVSEPNNNFAQAKNISLNKDIKGQIAINDEYDIYKINMPSDNMKITMTSYMRYYTMCIYDMNAKLVWYTDDNEWNEDVGKRTDELFPKLDKGSYYIKIVGKCCDESYDTYTGNYTFKITQTASNLILSKEQITLKIKGKETLKSTVVPSGTGEKVYYSMEDTSIATVSSSGVVIAKKAGHTTLTATVGDEITKKVDIFVKPKATAIKKLKAKTRKGLWGSKYRYINIKLKKINDVDYQIYYSKKKKGKYKELETIYSNKSSISVSKKGTYWIKVRTKIYSDGWYIYSNWTKPQKVKVK